MYSSSTIARSATILARAATPEQVDAICAALRASCEPVPAPKTRKRSTARPSQRRQRERATIERAVKASDDWRNLPASKGQMRRINSGYARLGLRTFESLADFRSVFATMGDASDEWNTVKASL